MSKTSHSPETSRASTPASVLLGEKKKPEFFDQLPPEKKKEVETLCRDIEHATKREEKLDDEINEANDARQTFEHLRDQLCLVKDEISTVETEYASKFALVNRMREEIENFPTDEQIVHLKVIVQQTQESIRQMQAEIQQEKKKVEETKDRLKAIQNLKTSFTQAFGSLLEETSAAVDAALGLKYADAACPVSLEDWIESFRAREEKLQDAFLETEDHNKNVQINCKEIERVKEQLMEDRENLKIDRERRLLQITKAWSEEKKELLEAYEKLQVVYKELTYHLNRGTYIKRLPVPPAIPPRESQLAQDATMYANDLLQLRRKLKEAKDKLYERHTVLQDATRGYKIQQERLKTAQQSAEAQTERSERQRKALMHESFDLQKLHKDLAERLSFLRVDSLKLIHTPAKDSNVQPDSPE